MVCGGVAVWYSVVQCGNVALCGSVVQWRVGFGLQANRIEFQSGLFTLWPGFKTLGQGWPVPVSQTLSIHSTYIVKSYMLIARQVVTLIPHLLHLGP